MNSDNKFYILILLLLSIITTVIICGCLIGGYVYYQNQNQVQNQGQILPTVFRPENIFGV